MGNIFLHEDAVLYSFKERVDGEGRELLASLGSIKIAATKNFDSRVKNSKKVENSNGEVEKLNGEVKEFNQGVEKFDERLTHLLIILQVIADQLKILKDFRRILDNNLPPGESHATRNAVRLPALDNQKEQIKLTLRVLEALVTERTGKIATLKEWQLGLQEMRKGWQMEFRETQKGLDSGTSLSTTVEMKSLLARQGQTVTMFTLVTAIFLPLGFFATVSLCFPFRKRGADKCGIVFGDE